MLISSVYFFPTLLLKSMDENDEIAATRSRILLISSRVTLGPGLGSGSVVAITRSTQDAKSMSSLVLQLRKSFIRVNPRYCARWIIAFSRSICRLKTLSGLRSGKRHDKNVTASGPRRGIISSCLLNQAVTIRASRSWILSLLDGFFRFLSSLLRRSHSELNGKGILI